MAFAVDVSHVVSEVMQIKDTAYVFGLDVLLFPLTMLIFPVLLLLVKLVGLINPGPEWKRQTIWITSNEGEWESSMQLLLTLFMIFTS